jgi:hypothetical protein
MRLHTASEVISLLRKLETESAAFYEELAAHSENGDAFSSFAAENRRNIVLVERAYYGVISDALEGGFAFDIESDDYELAASHTGSPRPDTLKLAIRLEERIASLYEIAAEQSLSLLADVPRVLRQMAKKKESRIERLGTLLGSVA